MKKNSTFKRFLAFLLCAAMMITYMPTSVYTLADEASDDAAVVEQQAETKAAADEAKAEEAQAETAPAEESSEETAQKQAKDASEASSKSEANETADPAEPADTEEPAVTEEETTQEEPVEEEEVKYPAQDFEGSASGVDVTVHAPEGALPEGATMKVSSVGIIQMAQVKSAVKDEMGNNAKVVKAVDITFYDADGNEIEPEEALSVSFNSAKFADKDDLSVVHIDDNKNAEKVSDKVVENNGEEVAFKADQFSIYVVVEGADPDARLNVIFHKADESTAEMSLTKNQLEAGQLNTNIYDPGVGTLKAGEVFKGWTDVEEYTAAGLEDNTNPAWTIADIRENVTTKLNAGTVKDGDEYHLYAMVFESFHVSYRDENATTIHTDEVLYKSGDTEVKYIIDRAYAPYYATKIDDSGEELSAKFSGWEQYEPEVTGGAPVYENETEVNLIALGLTADNSNLVVKAKVDYGHWIIFNSNASGASFTDPNFVQNGEVTVAPTAPTRNGYDFAGWFTSADDANNIQTWLKDNPGKTAADAPGYFAFGNTISVDQKLYAGWTTAAKADMLVYVWKESLSGNASYEFVKAVTIEDLNVGTSMSSYLTDADTTASSVKVNGTDIFVPLDSNANSANAGFLYEKYEASTDDGLISNDGTSILNIYFSRRTYTLKFYYAKDNQVSTAANTSYSSVTSSSDWGGSRPSVTFTPGTDSLSSSTYYYYGITAKYGEDISSAWPTYDMFGSVQVTSSSGGHSGQQTQTYNLISWVLMSKDSTTNFPLANSGNSSGSGSGGGNTVKGKLTVMDEQVLGDLSSADGNFLLASYGTGANDWTYNIYFEDANGTITYNGNKYSLHESVAVRSRGTTASSQHAPAYPGYTNVGEAKGSGYVMNYYYEPNNYTIFFNVGACTDGSGNPLIPEQKNQGTASCEYGAAISGHEPEDPTSLLGGESNRYVFVGWYEDEACTKEYSFTDKTMPQNDINVYAKFVLKEYEVVLHPNVDGDRTFEYGNKHAAGNFDGDGHDYFYVDNGESINGDEVGGTRDYYELIGWFAR